MDSNYSSLNSIRKNTNIMLLLLLLVSNVFYAQCDTPINIVRTSLTTNSISFYWSPPATGATGYDYYVTGDLINYPPIGAETNSIYTNATSGTYTGLAPGGDYKIYIRSRCGTSRSNWQSGGNLTTLEANSGCANGPYGVHPSATFTPSCSGNPETINTDAQAGEYCYINVIPNRQYVFSSSVATDYATITSSNLVSVIAHGSVPFVWNSGSYSGTVRYYLNTNGTCGTSTTDRTRLITCQVVPSTCAPPINLQTYSISSTGAILKWDFSGLFTGSQYYVSTSSALPSINQTPTGSAPNQDFGSVSGLTPNTTYYYWVRSKCGTDLTNWVAGGSFTTLTSNPVGCIGSIYGQNPPDPFTPACFGNSELIISNAYAGTYSEVNIIPNKVYTFTSSVSTDFITITDNDSFLVYASGTTPLVWSSGANTATIRFLLNSSSTCGTQSIGRAKSISCQAAIPTCTAPNSLVVSATTSTSATLSWTPASPTPASGYQYYYSTANTAPTSGTTPSGNSGTTVSLSGLAVGTTYYFWVRSNCGANQGNWVFGNSFATLGPGAGCTVAVFGQYPDSAFTPACFGVNENIVTDAYAGEYSLVSILPYKQYTFISSVASDYITITNADASVTYIAGNTPLVLSGFTNSGIIRFYLHTNNACGSQESTRTRSIICQDETAATCNIPTPTATTSITTTSATLNWTAASPAPSNGYHLYYSANNTAPTSGTTPSASATATNASITSLTSATTYYVWIRSNCGSSQSTWVSGGSFITLSSGSCNPPTPTATTVTSTTANFTWTAPNPAPTSGYQAYISTDNIAPTSGTTPTGSVTTTGGTLTGLDVSTTYYYWVRSNCGGSQSVWVSGGSFTTTATDGCTTASQGQYPVATFTPSCTGSAQLIVDNAYAGEYAMVSIAANRQYTFSSSVATDYVTIADNTGTIVYKHGPSPLVWLSGTNSGTFRYYFHTNDLCGEEFTNRSRFMSCTTALENVDFDASAFQCHPNPTSGLLNISYSSAIDRVEIFNMLGQAMMQQSIKATEATINMSRLASGTYFVKAYANDKSKVFKIIKE